MLEVCLKKPECGDSTFFNEGAINFDMLEKVVAVREVQCNERSCRSFAVVLGQRFSPTIASIEPLLCLNALGRARGFKC